MDKLLLGTDLINLAMAMLIFFSVGNNHYQNV